MQGTVFRQVDLVATAIAIQSFFVGFFSGPKIQQVIKSRKLNEKLKTVTKLQQK